MIPSGLQQFWQERTATQRPLAPCLKLAESFNPSNVKAGQWFTRPWLFGMAWEPVRLRVAKVIISPQGRRFQLVTPQGHRMEVDRYSLTNDFRRINCENGQPFTGDELPEAETPPDNKKHWYHET